MSVHAVEMYLDPQWNSFLSQGRSKMKLTKKMIVTFLTLALVFSCVSCTTIEVQAAPKVQKTQKYYFFQWPCDIVISAQNLSKTQKIEKSSIRSSRNNIKVKNVRYYKREGIRSGILTLTVKKAGTSTISFKIGKKKYQTKIIAKKYVNPVRFLTISGIKDGDNTDLADLTKNFDMAQSIRPYKTVDKNAKIQVEAINGWKIKNINALPMPDYSNLDKEYDYKFKNIDRTYKNPPSKVTVNVGEIQKEGHYSIGIKFMNTKTKDVILLEYNINWWSDSPHDNINCP